MLDAAKLSRLSALRARQKWLVAARPKQLFPEDELWWNIALLMAGRGFGKTRPFAEDAWWQCYSYPGLIYHVIARTDDDLRITCYEGESGLRAVCPPELLYKGSWDKAYNASLQQVTFANGSQTLGFAAKVPGQLRGPQCHRFWGDEVAAWEENGSGKTKETLDNALLGCRLPRNDGIPSRGMLSTTPRPLDVLRELLKRDDIITRTGSLYENIANLSDNFKNTILPLEGTRIGDQEIHGKLLDMEELGVIKRSWFPLYPAHRKGCPGAQTGCSGCNPLPRFEYILSSYDTALEEEKRDKKRNEPDFSANITFGLFRPSLTAPKLRAMVLDVWDERLGMPDLVKKVQEDINTKWGEKPYQRVPDMTLIENKTSGISLRQTIAQLVPKANVQTYTPKMSKLARLHLTSPLVKQGAIWLPESASQQRRPRTWLGTMLNQVCSFTGEGSITHDDFVDSFTQALIIMQHMELLTPTVADPVDPDVDPSRIQEERDNPYA